MYRWNRAAPYIWHTAIGRHPDASGGTLTCRATPANRQRYVWTLGTRRGSSGRYIAALQYTSKSPLYKLIYRALTAHPAVSDRVNAAYSLPTDIRPSLPTDMAL